MTRFGMLNDSKIMTKTSVGRVVKVAIMRYNLGKKTCPCIYVWGGCVRMTLSSCDGNLAGRWTTSRRRRKSRERRAE